MKKFLLLLFCYCFLIGIHISNAQLIVTENTSATALAQKLVGNGVTISNATFTGNSHMGGFFNNISGTNIGIDSGIVLCTGRVKTNTPFKGIDGDGVTMAMNFLLDNVFGLPGDVDISNATGRPSGDAAVLEFDFVPLGDSINVKYVFGSEEYHPDFICYFPDAFAFFISGPGITGLKNIALVPSTNLPVGNATINGVLNSDGTDCRINQIYYVDNSTNTYMNYDGETVLLKASEKVQPCQVYHLKLVIADLTTNLGSDSGVFLEAQSLTSNTSSISNLTQTDPATGKYYVVEGCSTGSVKIQRQTATASPQTVNLAYTGTALNTIDVNTLPASVVIPANQTSVTLNINPVVDNIPEGIELLKIYTLANAACAVSNVYTDSTEIEIRDYDTLSLTPKKANICRNSSIQLAASTGYTTYAWDANPTLNNTGIRNPVATPTTNTTTYYCTANIGNCHARDSVFLRWKDIELISTKNINCKNGTTGQIKIAGGPEWLPPLVIWSNNNPFQSDSVFNNLPVGNYSIKVKDATGCIDSIAVNLIQAYPNLVSTTTPVAATCSGNADGLITVNTNGGLTPYQYSIDNGTNYQTGNTFNTLQGTYPILVKDFNGCLSNTSAIVALNNDISLTVGNTATICEGSNTILQAVSNATGYSWTPVTGLSTPLAATTQASPVVTTKYYITAKKGICNKKDSVQVNVNAAPVANAGLPIAICFGASTSLNGSGGIDYTWTPATYLDNANIAQPNVIRPANNITYSLQVKDANGCKSLNTAQVQVSVTPAVQIFAPTDTVAAIYQPLQLYAIDINNSGINSYLWSPAYGLNSTNIPRPITTLDVDMVYTVTGKTAAGCEGTAIVKVKVFEGPEIYVPTAFTPNGDNNNDLLRAKPIGIKTFIYFRVYNRWGQLMFSTSDFSKGWDGNIQGQAQGSGSYVWIAEGIDFKGRVINRKGSSILMR